MAAALRISNIPSYISEPEFKRIFTQPALECLGCNFVKNGPNGETIGLARFPSQQAAANAMSMYQGWQGFGNPEGLVINFADEPGMRMKREREDLGREDASFKQSRVLGAGTMGFGGGGGYQPELQQRQNDQFPHQTPGLATSSAPGFGHSSQPLGNEAYGQAGSPLLRPEYGVKPEVRNPNIGNAGPRGAQQANQAGILRPPSQGQYNAPDIQPTLQQGPNMAQNHNQPNQGLLPNANVSGNMIPGFQPAVQSGPMGQQFANQQQQQGPVGGGFQGNGNNFGLRQGGNEQYDPQQPQLGGPGQQAQPMLQPQGNMSNATLADVLGPLLQQPGAIQNLSGLLASGNLNPNASQNPNPLPQNNPLVQLGQMPLQDQRQALAGAMVQPQAQPQALPAPLEQLPLDAGPTLYVDGMTLDVTKREMSHIFRPFEGFKEVRIVEKKDKNNKTLIIGFAEFNNAHQAAAALKVLQSYPIDMANPSENQLRLSFAKPLKSNDPRNRNNKPYNPVQFPTQNEPARDFRGTGGRGEGGGRGDRDRRGFRDRRGQREERRASGSSDRRR